MRETSSAIGTREVIFLIVGLLAVGFLLFSGSKPDDASSIESDIRTITQECRALGDKETCYAKSFERLTTETDMDYAFLVLRELQKKDPQARGCHFISHSISTAETQKDTSKWREIMNRAPQDCSYGAAHGAIEVYASTFPDGKLPEEEIPLLCDNPDTNNCTHALGHLLLVMTENDIDESVEGCGTLPHNDLGKFECLTGVFMERITAFNLEAHGLADKEALNWPARVPELEALCRKQSGVNSVACWKEIVHAVLVKVNNNPQKLVDYCETAPGEEETRQCIDHALGIMAAGFNFDLSKMGSICNVDIADPDFKNRCYAHLVAATISTIPTSSPEAVRFCSKLPDPYQESCFTMLGNSLQRALPEHKSLLARECSKAPSAFRERCESGGPSSVRFYSGN